MSRRRRYSANIDHIRAAAKKDFRVYPVATFSAIAESVRKRLADREARPRGAECHSYSNDSDGGRWDGGMSLREAGEALRTGWTAGNVDIAHALDVRDAEQSPTGGYDLDVAGDFPCVPAFIAGEPECMYRKEPGEAPRRVRLVIFSWYVCSTTAQQAIAYASATASLAALLMARGFDVAITSLYVAADRHNDYHTGIIPIPVKEYGQEPDGSRIAFATHPAFMRRGMFAHLEMSEEYPVFWCSDGYGTMVRDRLPEHVIRDAVPDSGDERLIVLPMFSELPECITPEQFADAFAARINSDAEMVQS
jgi:hypothetical protein